MSMRVAKKARKSRPGPAVPARRRGPAPAKRRRCILSRRELSTAALIRFVAGPDNCITADLAERLPGRGLWLSASRSALEEARSNGSFARAARRAVKLRDGLADLVAEQLALRALNYLGLALRSGAIAIGHDQVRADLSAGRAAVLLQAGDGAPLARARMRALASGLPSVEMFTRGELSGALGRADIVHAALRPSRLSDMFLQESGRLAGFRAIGESRLPATGDTANEFADRVGNE